MESESLDSVFHVPIKRNPRRIPFLAGSSADDPHTQMVQLTNDASFGKMIHIGQGNSTPWAFKSKCLSWLKFIAWLIMMEGLNTKFIVHRRNLNVQPEMNCVLCSSQCVEDLHHLFFFYCSFAVTLAKTWDRMARCIWYPWPWEIWNMRNGKIFEVDVPSLAIWTVKFISSSIELVTFLDQ